jgi:hypothetical protein
VHAKYIEVYNLIEVNFVYVDNHMKELTHTDTQAGVDETETSLTKAETTSTGHASHQ